MMEIRIKVEMGIEIQNSKMQMNVNKIEIAIQ